MYRRLCSLSDENSFFLFGARGCGKSTLLRAQSFLKKALYLDLLDSETESAYALRPQLLLEQAQSLKPGQWVVIDEIQKCSKLLDIVHKCIEEYQINFALTGSSSRKLKRSGANLLAGRAFNFALFPFSFLELGKDFNLANALSWGTLPKIYSFKTNISKARFLKSYLNNYIKEEVVAEQLVRNLDPFRLFLPIAAQMNGKIVNYSNISKDTGVSYKTIESYYQILEETYLGFFLNAHHLSVRKAQIQSPKFYLFDLGVVRALENKLGVPIVPQTNDYGNYFESFFINECIKLNLYFEKDFKFSFLKSKDDVEVDLIVERPGLPEVLIEIKSSSKIDERHLKSLLNFKKDFPRAQLMCASQVKVPQKISGIDVLPWMDVLKLLFT